MDKATALVQLSSPRWFGWKPEHSWYPSEDEDGYSISPDRERACTVTASYWKTDLVILFEQGPTRVRPVYCGRAVYNASWHGPVAPEPNEGEEAEEYTDRESPCRMSTHRPAVK